jgi:hypothetical protein
MALMRKAVAPKVSIVVSSAAEAPKRNERSTLKRESGLSVMKMECLSSQKKKLASKMLLLKETKGSAKARLRIQLGPAVGGPDVHVGECYEAI